jgi:hypothetical protein
MIENQLVTFALHHETENAVDPKYILIVLFVLEQITFI